MDALLNVASPDRVSSACSNTSTPTQTLAFLYVQQKQQEEQA